MASMIRVAAIPTLTQLYRSGQIVALSNADLPSGIQAHNDKICTIQHDITKLEVDSIVNAANGRLLGGGGVDGAIHRAAGSGLLRECRTLGGCDTGSAKITGAYNLPCKKVIHAVGPIYDSPDESEPLLRGCYRTSLQLAVGNNCKSIAFSAISTGIYGYPSSDAAAAALDEVKKFLERPEGEKIEKVIFCNFMDKDVDAYADALPYIFPATEEDRKHKVRSIWETSGEAETEAEPAVSGEVGALLKPSVVKATSHEDTVAQDEGCADSNHTPERDPTEDGYRRAGGSSETDRGELVVGANPGFNRNAVQPGNADRRVDSGATKEVPHQQHLALDDEPQHSQSSAMKVDKIFANKESGVVEEKDIVGNTRVGDDHNLLKSMRDNTNQATGDLPDDDVDLELSRCTQLGNSTEARNARDILAGKLDAMNVSIQEVDGTVDESDVA